VVEGE